MARRGLGYGGIHDGRQEVHGRADGYDVAKNSHARRVACPGY